MDMETRTMAPSQATLRHSPRRMIRSLLATFLAIATLSPAPEANAQWLVQDPAAIFTAVQEYATQAKRWIETAQHYKDTIQHYADQVAFWKQQLVKLQGLNLEVFKLENQFRHIPEDANLAETCPGAVRSHFDITTVLESLVPNMGGDIVKEQNRVCESILRSNNRKYNLTVDYYNFLKTSMKDLETIHSDRLSKVGESVANLSSILTDTQRYAANIDEARKKWEGDVAQQDLVLSMLTAQQAMLARRAMNGSPSPLGTLVNTAALRAAFTH